MPPSLPLFHRVAGQPVIVLGQGDAADAKRRLVAHAGADVIDDLQSGIDRGARLAFIAHADAAMCEADALRARCAGLLVNVVDRPGLCDFTTPAILERGPVQLAVGTGGASAGLAKAIRLRLEALLPPTLGTLATALHGARAALRARFPDPGQRRRALDAALAQAGPLDPFDPQAAANLPAWLETAAATPDATREIHPRSADPDDLTLGEARLLGSADTLAHEPAVPLILLARARADAARIAIPPGEVPLPRPGLTVILRAPPA
ncbi:MAG: bifunctional precorrin-2 dehydrogenase/sirohydrochlorin ferrochelatase [Sphingomonadales bacterium]|nr:bifunctional precorrin-2 dehydrogenase/sirohydrochlorin ferrochelatase [Sphingomonadales bacterium]